MKRSAPALAALGLLVTGLAYAKTQNPGIFTSTGTVTANNGQSSCGQVGFTVGAANLATLFYPGDGKTGLRLYTPSYSSLVTNEVLQACTFSAAVPNTGLNGFKTTASCTELTPLGPLTVTGVGFAFTATSQDLDSGIGTTTVTIPSNSPLGANCQATISVALVRSGK